MGATAKPRPVAAVSPPAAPPAKAAGGAKGKKSVDALTELERLRKENTQSRPAASRAPVPVASANGHGQLYRDIQLTLKRADFERARRFSLTLQVEDERHQVVEAVRGLEVEIQNPNQLEKVLLKLNIALNSKD
jgi:hypothetical protein